MLLMALNYRFVCGQQAEGGVTGFGRPPGHIPPDISLSRIIALPFT